MAPPPVRCPGQTRREAGTQSQGSSPPKTARLPSADEPRQTRKESNVKGNLVRLTWALALLASMALTIGAGLRWS